MSEKKPSDPSGLPKDPSGESPSQDIGYPEQSGIRHEISIGRWQGPLPPPSSFEHYEQVLPGAAERILRMAEEQSSHRRKIESLETDRKISSSRANTVSRFLGQILATAIIFATLYAVFELAKIEAYWVAGVIGAIPLGTITWAMVSGRIGKQDENAEKRR